MPQHFDQIGFLVELKAKQELHSVPARLEQAIFIGRAEQQGEIGQRQRHRRLSALDDELPLVDREV